MKPFLFGFLGACLLVGGIVWIAFRSGGSSRKDAGIEAGPIVPDAAITGKVSGESPGPARDPADPPSRRLPGGRPSAGPKEVPAEDPVLHRLPVAKGTSSLTFALGDRDGVSIPEARVRILSGRESAEQTSDAEGRAEFRGIHSGTYSFRVTVANVPELAGARGLTLGEGEEKELRLEVDPHEQAIAGRILDGEGAPLEGVTVTAREELTQVGEEKLVRLFQEDIRASTDAAGAYELSGLAAADYVVATERAGGFPAVRKVFRAPTRSADLVIEATREVELRGVVTARDGGAVEGAVVMPAGQPGRQALSDAEGRYATTVDVAPEAAVLVLIASKEGYREARVNVPRDSLGEAEAWDVDLVLDPIGALASVSGALADAEGTPIVGETVFLQSSSLNARYETRSDARGAFAFDEVLVGSDYRVLVYPKSPHKGAWLQDYSRPGLEVPESGLRLECVLERVEGGSLKGSFVDATGKPVANFTLWLRTLRTLGNAVALSSDADGRFQAPSVPAGEVLLETRSLPRFSVRGIRLAAGEERDVAVVLDWGKETLGGKVVDPDGKVLPGSKVSLHWTHSSDGIESTSFRSTVADAEGRFVFSELSPGEHKLTASIAGHLQLALVCEVGGGAKEVALRLERVARVPSGEEE